MQGTVAGRDLLQPRSLGDAVKMLRDEGPLVPMAGCTDLYVALNFGTLRPTRFLNLWTLDSLRGIEVRGATLRIGALTITTVQVPHDAAQVAVRVDDNSAALGVATDVGRVTPGLVSLLGECDAALVEAPVAR